MKISSGTILRTLLLVLAIINNSLTLFGKSPLPIDNEELSAAVSFCFTTAAALTAWWKNNSFSPEALAADEALKEERAHYKSK